MTDIKLHWESVYQAKAPDAVSWYSPHLVTSLRLIGELSPSKDAAIIDVGGGEATLVDDLLADDYTQLSVLDISQAAVDVTRQRLGAHAAQVHWLVADIASVRLDTAHYDLWHDRAVFHFLTTAAARQAYVRQLAHALKPGGHAIMATFGPDGPLKCSGLDIVRYDAASLQRELGPQFTLLDSFTEPHQTPFGTTQQFLYGVFRRAKP